VPVDEIAVTVWPVRDSGLAVAGPGHRRLPGALRHHRGEGETWPDRVTLRLTRTELIASDIGRWPLADVSIGDVQSGPPVMFVLRTPAGAHLLGMAAGEPGASFVAALTESRPSSPH
jgi:hypothetical protein